MPWELLRLLLGSVSGPITRSARALLAIRAGISWLRTRPALQSAGFCSGGSDADCSEAAPGRAGRGLAADLAPHSAALSAGMVAGTVGGFLLAAAPGSDAPLAVAGVLAAIGAGCGAVGGAGIGYGISAAEATARSQRAIVIVFGAALGGAFVGSAVQWLGRLSLSTLVGVHVSIGGGLEGLVLGAAAGVRVCPGYASSGGQSRSTTWWRASRGRTRDRSDVRDRRGCPEHQRPAARRRNDSRDCRSVGWFTSDADPARTPDRRSGLPVRHSDCDWNR